VRCLLDLFDRDGIAYAYLFNTSLSHDDFLRYLALELGAPELPASNSERLLKLNAFLLNRHRRNLRTVLVVDEAQNLRTEVLEEVRLLTNLETAQAKLIQIILVGQPELEARLDSYELRQLKQRVALRLHLNRLTEEQTRRYIDHHLTLAGGNSCPVFTAAAIHHIFICSGGIPRLINILCDNALVTAYLLRQYQVTPAMVDEVAADLRYQPQDEAEEAEGACDLAGVRVAGQPDLGEETPTNEPVSANVRACHFAEKVLDQPTSKKRLVLPI